MKMKHHSGLLILALGFLYGCDAVTGSGWSVEKEISGIDGQILKATRDFTLEGNQSMIRVILTCQENLQDLAITVESYNAVSSDKTYDPSEFADDGNGDPKGRIAFQSVNGSKETRNFADLFSTAEYNNVASLSLANYSAANWMISDEKAFWRWAADRAPTRGGASIEDFAETLAQTVGAMVMFGSGLQAAFSGASQEQIAYAASARIAPEFVQYARNNGNLSPLAPGAILKKMLPMSIEIYNSGGSFELMIPSDNSSVQTVADACDGGPGWWDK